MNAKPTAARTALPACARNHPGIASRITVATCTRTSGTIFQRATCAVCKSVKATGQHQERAEAGRRGVLSPLALRPYGVARLDWAVPEVLFTSMESPE